jgi:fatty acid desaturase
LEATLALVLGDRIPTGGGIACGLREVAPERRVGQAAACEFDDGRQAVQLHVSSVQVLVRRGMRHRTWETLTLGLHAAGYLTAVLLVLPPVKAAVFIVVQQALFGLYLGCSFAPNHKGMPMLSADDQGDFLRRQVLTARNVRGNWLVAFALGGLNYQIEHHLFPSMPRPNLRRAQPIIA